MDLRAKQQEFESALSNQEPDRVARALVLPPIAPVQAKKEPKPRSPGMELFVDDVDYGSVWTSWLDACAYAEAVSNTIITSSRVSGTTCIFIFIHIHSLYSLVRSYSYSCICMYIYNIFPQQGYANKCYESQASGVHSSLNRIFGTSEGNWLVPALHVVCKYTHKVALAADKENSKGGRQNMAKLQNAVQLLQDSYSKTFNDRTEYQVSNMSCHMPCHMQSILLD
jgi:hypothetical protein